MASPEHAYHTVTCAELDHDVRVRAAPIRERDGDDYLLLLMKRVLRAQIHLELRMELLREAERMAGLIA